MLGRFVRWAARRVDPISNAAVRERIFSWACRRLGSSRCHRTTLTAVPIIAYGICYIVPVQGAAGSLLIAGAFLVACTFAFAVYQVPAALSLIYWERIEEFGKEVDSLVFGASDLDSAFTSHPFDDTESVIGAVLNAGDSRLYVYAARPLYLCADLVGDDIVARIREDLRSAIHSIKGNSERLRAALAAHQGDLIFIMPDERSPLVLKKRTARGRALETLDTHSSLKRVTEDALNALYDLRLLNHRITEFRRVGVFPAGRTIVSDWCCVTQRSPSAGPTSLEKIHELLPRAKDRARSDQVAAITRRATAMRLLARLGSLGKGRV